MPDRFERAKRIALVLLMLGAVFAAAWVVLPALRGLMLPSPPAGGWVLGPDRALRFAACAITSALILPFLIRPLALSWRAKDLEKKAPPPAAPNPGLLLKGALLCIIYAVCAAFYFLSWTEITNERVTVHSPLGARSHQYDEIVALERVARQGGMSERYGIHFRDDSWAYFGVDNEGASEADIRAIADLVAQSSGERWIRVLHPR